MRNAKADYYTSMYDCAFMYVIFSWISICLTIVVRVSSVSLSAYFRPDYKGHFSNVYLCTFGKKEDLKISVHFGFYDT